MKIETLEKAKKLDEAIHGIRVVLNAIRSGEEVNIYTSRGFTSIAPYKKELQQIMAETLARLEAELERL